MRFPSYVIKVLLLSSNFCGNHILFGWIVDGLVQVGPCFFNVVDACNAQRLKEREYRLSILDALCGTDEGNVPSFSFIPVENGCIGPTIEDGSELASDIMGIGNATVEAEATCGWEGMGCVADTKHPR